MGLWDRMRNMRRISWIPFVAGFLFTVGLCVYLNVHSYYAGLAAYENPFGITHSGFECGFPFPLPKLEPSQTIVTCFIYFSRKKSNIFAVIRFIPRPVTDASDQRSRLLQRRADKIRRLQNLLKPLLLAKLVLHRPPNAR